MTSAPSVVPVVREVTAAHGTVNAPSASDTAPVQRDIESFFASILPEQDVYFVATPNPAGKGWKHYPCVTFREMADKAVALDAAKRDAYFACASYAKQSYVDKNGQQRQRTRENAAWVQSFWIDIDCGEDKAAKGTGYAKQREALAALLSFVNATGLPEPMVVLSGGGFHCYWPLEAAVAKHDWIPVAEKLKRLMACADHELLADPSRTSDISSVLRPPETHNWKSERGGAEVKLLQTAEPIPFEAFRELVDAACKRLTEPLEAITYATLGTNVGQVPNSLTLEQVEEALTFIDPECSRKEWWKIIPSVADAYGETARPLLRRWSKGELHGKQASNYDEQEFERQFDDVLRRRGSVEQPATMGSVVAKAREAGWIDPRKGSEALWVAELNREYAWIERDASIYRIGYRNFIDPARLKLQLDNQLIEVGTGKDRKMIGRGSAWLKHSNRRQHRELVIRPAEGEVTADNCLNEWVGYAVPESAGNVKPFLRLLLRLVPNKAARRYVLKWLAHLIQHPNMKMHVSLVFWSHEQGVGKNLFFEAIVQLIGPTHAGVIGQAELTGDFNEWANRRVFVIGDEVSSSDKRTTADRLKGLITGTTLRINEKYQPAREVQNLLNFVFLSNRNDTVFLDDHDRRYFVWEIRAGALPQRKADAFAGWRNNGGLPALLRFLRNFDVSGFDPKAPAPLTEAKREMIEDNRSDFEAWTAELMGSNVAQVLGRELITSSELAQRYARETQRQAPSAKTVVGVCKNLRAYARPNQVRVNGKKLRCMALARMAHWTAQPEADWANEMTKALTP